MKPPPTDEHGFEIEIQEAKAPMEPIEQEITPIITHQIRGVNIKGFIIITLIITTILMTIIISLVY